MSRVHVRPPVLLAAVFFLAALAAGAQSLSVSYLEGSAQVRTGSAWTELAVGDAVPVDATVRLQGPGILQLHGTGAEFFINRPGTYVLREIVAARQKLSTRTSSGAVVNGLRRLVGAESTAQSTTGGARAAEQVDSSGDDWVESSAQPYLDAGRAYLERGKLQEAEQQLALALESALPEEVAEIRYYQACAASMDGDTRGAWTLLEGLQPDASDAWAADFVLLKAKMLQDSNAFAESVSWLESQDLSRDRLRSPLFFYLLGTGALAAGDGPKSDRAFREVQRIAPGSDLARAAADFMAN